MIEHFGNYEILRKIATGGMAEVYLAKQTSIGGFERLVCIKRILDHLGEQEDFITMFQDEARIAANFTHPNVAQIYDIGQVDGSYYIAMEYVRGEDLRRIYNGEVSRGRAMPVEPAAQIAMGAAAGLDYAHRQTTIDGRPLGIVHRDVSPQNILVTYDGHVKLVDFGVAKAAVKMNQTRSGVLKGKYSYMSPEQASGDPIDARTDVFALAITLYEVTTGTRLFKRENELETLHAVIECDVKPPSDVIPGYDPDLESIILRALAYDPDDRFASAGQFERELEGFLLARSHPTSASGLGGYMQDLFAEKLADELLFGGQPWEENHTPTNRATRKSERRSSSKHRDDSSMGSQPTDAAPRPLSANEKTEVDDLENDGWGDDDKPKRRKSSRSGATLGDDDPDRTVGWGESVPGMRPHQGWDTGSRSASRSNTTTVAEDGGAVAAAEAARPVVMQRPLSQSRSGPIVITETRYRKMRMLPAIAVTVLVIGSAVGVGLMLGSSRSQVSVDSSGPLTLDSEPRGARVTMVGLGADAINDRYDGFRTPYTIKEGIAVDLKLRARFIKDGFEITESDLPKLEASMVPKPLFVELKNSVEGSEPSSLTLLSTPPGASVYIDGERIEGRTPIRQTRVSGGEMHRVELHLAGYSRRWESMFVEPGSHRFIEMTLHPADGSAAPKHAGNSGLTGTNAAGVTSPKTQAVKPPPKVKPKKPASNRAFLSITSSMKLKISVDGRHVGETPAKRLSLAPGVRKLELESLSEGFVLKRKVRLAAGRTESIDLRPRKGKLALNATPWAWVNIGKGSPKETPLRLDVFEGDYTVVFECPDGRMKRQHAHVNPGQTSAVSINCRN